MKIIVAIIIFLFLPVLGECQAFSTEEQLEIDKLNSNIDNTNSHDTTNALAYIGLSEYLYISNFDTLLYLCEKAQNLAENGIKNTLNPTLQSKTSISVVKLALIGLIWTSVALRRYKVGDSSDQARILPGTST